MFTGREVWIGRSKRTNQDAVSDGSGPVTEWLCALGALVAADGLSAAKRPCRWGGTVQKSRHAEPKPEDGTFCG